MHRLPALLWEKRWQRDKYREKDLLSCLCKGAGFFMGQVFFEGNPWKERPKRENNSLLFYIGRQFVNESLFFRQLFSCSLDFRLSIFYYIGNLLFKK